MDRIGLTTEEAIAAAGRGQANIQEHHTQKTAGQIVKENIFTYFNLIFFVLAVFLIIAGTYRSLTILFAPIFNSLIGIAQQLRAKKVLDDLSVLDQPVAKVYRDGKQIRIPVEELVLHDVVAFASGSQVCADAVLLTGEVAVNESLLTGEEDEIVKKKGDRLLSGSFVISGECTARLTQVGADSYISKLTRQAKKMPGNEQSEMVRSIDRFVLFAGVAIVPVGILLLIQGIHQGNSFSGSVTSMVAAVVGMIPEGLYLLVSMTLALSAAKLAAKKVMLHDMKSIETLARVDVLCVDKTGTITENEMKVAGVYPSVELAKDQQEEAEEKLGMYLSAQKDNNPTMLALKAYIAGGREEKPLYILPFSSKNKYSAAVFAEGTYVLGAPDIILKEQGIDWGERTGAFEEKGMRTLVFAGVEGDFQEEGLYGCRISPLLYIALHNPVRENAKDVFSYFDRQEVQVKVISGDNPVTVSRIAGQAVIRGAELSVDATTLETEEEIERAVQDYTVFGRVTPEQKRLIVKALQKQGHTVAMTGDGVNDIMAMKAADCSVAMTSGSDAAVQAAQVVLMDSDFVHMPQIVSEGRILIGNMERSATLFLTKNLFSLMMAVFSIINVIAYPLVPEQISLISGFNIGIPAFLLALEPNERRITGHFMPKVLRKAMPAALTDFFAIAALVVFGSVFEVSGKDISVAATFLLAIVGFMILHSISQPLNLYRKCVILGCMAGLVVTAFFLHDLFAIQAISLKCILLFEVFAIATEPCMRYMTRLFGLLEGYNISIKKSS